MTFRNQIHFDRFAALILAALILSLPAGAAPLGPSGQRAVSENEVKAAFLLNFARFVEWPADSSDSEEKSLRIVVLGDDDLADAVSLVVAGKGVPGRPLVVDHVYRIEDAGECQILFVGASQDRNLEEIFEAVEERPVLTVGDSRRFVRLGGMIRFAISDGRLRFEVNLDAARAPGLRISSRLLGVASAVHAEGLGEN